VTLWFSKRLSREPSEVVALATALNIFSMGAGLGLGTLVGWSAGPWVARPLAPLVASIGFLLLAGIEMGIVGYSHPAGGVGGDLDA